MRLLQTTHGYVECKVTRKEFFTALFITGLLIISGTVPDKGFDMVANQPVPQQGTQLKLTMTKISPTLTEVKVVAP